jgi:hypothetical protein
MALAGRAHAAAAGPLPRSAHDALTGHLDTDTRTHGEPRADGDHYDPLRPSMPAAPCLENAAPGRASTGEVLFRATQGTRQQPS